MLDLTALQIENYKLKLFDERVLEIQKANQKLLIELSTIDSIKEIDVMVRKVNKLTTQILNLNIEGLEFKENQVETMFSFDICLLILKDYLSFCFENLKN